MSAEKSCPPKILSAEILSDKVYTLKTKDMGQFKFRTSFCPKFRRLITQARTPVVEKGYKNQLLMCERIFNKVNNQLSTSDFRDRALKFCPKLKCPKLLVSIVRLEMLSTNVSMLVYNVIPKHWQWVMDVKVTNT